MKILIGLLTMTALVLMATGCSSQKADEDALHAFIDKHVTIVEPLNKEMILADWNANATGEERYYTEKARLELELRKIYSDREEFAFLKGLKEKGTIGDPLLSRQLVLLYNGYLSNQIDTALMKKIVDKGAEIAQKFNTFRGKIDGKAVNDNDISTILKNEKNSAKRQKAWEASKQVGAAVAPLVVELVKLRNEAAKQLGYDNFYVMSLAVGEQNEAEILKIFDDLKQRTDAPFKELKAEIDRALAERYGITVAELRPWHYEDPFFQEAPAVNKVSLDGYFKKKDIPALATKYYTSIGLEVEDVLKRSDLFPRSGKYQHAFCTDVDRKGDVRVMMSVIDDHRWMGTTLHELGHAVYSKYVEPTLPFLLRSEAHTFTTEAIAQLMERQSSNADWLQKMVGIDDKEKEEIQSAVKANLRMKELIFSRWSQVMVRFERAMYSNPEQDLNKLWWDLVEEQQLVKRPENRNQPDWAAKIHLAQYPVYYHNYMLGELLTSQLTNAIKTKIVKAEGELAFNDKPDIGKFLKENVFTPGARYRWDEMITKATGEPLTSKYFVEEFVGK